MTTLLLALSAPALLILLAVATIGVRTWCGECPAHQRYAWLRSRPSGAAGLPDRRSARFGPVRSADRV